MTRPRAGLLSLYAELYDQQDSHAKDVFTPFIDDVVSGLTGAGLDILRVPVCIYEQDVRRAVRQCESEGVDGIIVLYLAYHPSLASARVLAGTALPVIMLDTTVCHSFNETTDPAMIGQCHGIHGVQDLCCVLRRMHKSYFIEAGHYLQSDVLQRTAGVVKACQAARCMKNCRVGLIGEPFKDMGDFAIPFPELRQQIGIQTIDLKKETVTSYRSFNNGEAIWQQISAFRATYQVMPDVDIDLLEKAAENQQVIARWIADEKLDAFTFNFLSFNGDTGFATIPFAAATDLMATGTGYAGEGDVLTAALCASLLKMFPDTTFTEMFCPDWAGGRVFMSHMGEANRRILHEPALLRKHVPYVPSLNQGDHPGVAGTLKAGKAVLVNVSPGPENQYTIILAPCRIVLPAGEDRFDASIRGWLEPQDMALETFLENYSLLGGTHHSCLCYDADLKSLEAFAGLMGWRSTVIAGRG
ncbi:MAG: hypothetical protein GX173_13450 [Ruminococcaceae bacterium]|nr:hypothetical protein [Oscillospiraceae bacterium]